MAFLRVQGGMSGLEEPRGPSGGLQHTLELSEMAAPNLMLESGGGSFSNDTFIQSSSAD